jgi:hypothetical protein
VSGGRERSSPQGLCRGVSKLSILVELLQVTREDAYKASWVKAVSWCLCTFVTLVNLFVDLPPKNKDTPTLAWLTRHVAWSRNTINARTGEWRCLEQTESQCAPPGLRPPLPSHHPIKWLCAARRPKAKRYRRSRRRNHMQRRPPAQKRGQRDPIEHVLDGYERATNTLPYNTIRTTLFFFFFFRRRPDT